MLLKVDLFIINGKVFKKCIESVLCLKLEIAISAMLKIGC